MAKDKSVKVVNNGSVSGVVYFMTVVGAAVYFTQMSEGFWATILALLKALVWPGFVAYEVLKLLNV